MPILRQRWNRCVRRTPGELSLGHEDQPRDQSGRWTSGGGGDADPTGVQHDVNPAVLADPRYDPTGAMILRDSNPARVLKTFRNPVEGSIQTKDVVSAVRVQNALNEHPGVHAKLYYGLEAKAALPLDQAASLPRDAGVVEYRLERDDRDALAHVNVVRENNTTRGVDGWIEHDSPVQSHSTPDFGASRTAASDTGPGGAADRAGTALRASVNGSQPAAGEKGGDASGPAPTSVTPRDFFGPSDMHRGAAFRQAEARDKASRLTMAGKVPLQHGLVRVEPVRQGEHAAHNLRAALNEHPDVSARVDEPTHVGMQNTVRYKAYSAAGREHAERVVAQAETQLNRRARIEGVTEGAHPFMRTETRRTKSPAGLSHVRSSDGVF